MCRKCAKIRRRESLLVTCVRCCARGGRCGGRGRPRCRCSPRARRRGGTPAAPRPQPGRSCADPSLRQCVTLPSHIVTSSRLELQTNLRKSFHNHIEEPYKHLSTFFQPGKGPSSGLLRDCENFAEGSLRALVCSPESRHLCMRWAWPMTSLAAVYRRAGTSRATG